MASFNLAVLIGYLGQDPEIRYTQSGTAICSFSLATTESFKDKSGDYKKRTDWHKITCFGKTAENCAQYLSKGSSVVINGRIQYESWEDKEGNKRHSTSIVANNITFLDKKKSEAPPPAAGSSDPKPLGDESFNPDGDVPF